MHPAIIAAAAAGGLGLLLFRNKINLAAASKPLSDPAQVAKQLADPAQLAAIVDKQPPSAVSSSVVSAIQSQPGDSTAAAELANRTADKLAAAQAAALAKPSASANAAVLQAAVDNAAATAAEDQAPSDGIHGEGGRIVPRRFHAKIRRLLRKR